MRSCKIVLEVFPSSCFRENQRVQAWGNLFYFQSGKLLQHRLSNFSIHVDDEKMEKRLLFRLWMLSKELNSEAKLGEQKRPPHTTYLAYNLQTLSKSSSARKDAEILFDIAVTGQLLPRPKGKSRPIYSACCLQIQKPHSPRRRLLRSPKLQPRPSSGPLLHPFIGKVVCLPNVCQ